MNQPNQLNTNNNNQSAPPTSASNGTPQPNIAPNQPTPNNIQPSPNQPPRPTPPTQIPPTPTTPIAPAIRPSLSNKKHLIILSIIIALVLIAGITYWLIKPKPTTSPVVQQENRSVPGQSVAPADLSTLYDKISSTYNIPEFSTSNKDLLLSKYSELSEGFELLPNSFDDTTALHALGIASLYAKDEKNRSQYREELYLLLINQLKSVPPQITDSTFVPQSNGDDTIKILTSFEDRALTKQVEQSKEMQKALDSVVSSLKLKGRDDLVPHRVIAFNFDTDSKQFDELVAKRSLYGARPTMWVEIINDTTYIMMFRPYAESVINGEKNSLAHELIHAQSAFVRGEAGRMIEERRAELFSGDTSAYYEAKQFMVYLRVFSGVDVTALLEQYPTNPAQFYAELYKRLGITITHDIVFSWPNAYGSGESKALSNIFKLNLHDRAIKGAVGLGQKDKTSMNKRIDERYQKLLDVFKTKSAVIDDLNNNLGQNYRMPTATKYMIERINSR